ncbi:fatty acid desaturase [Croceivirga thetidis]|uniref:Acyl-CoA desaturase n=1 Tax=Croceivirga thetidis TaxID=2721623 RepID=A0ABX1GWK9_9FLAO|nr:fatty acid desaturase [Croceivirga thetidis]NKI33270.1 acyl-CoA desaturase [Croceivirga thetidis]
MENLNTEVGNIYFSWKKTFWLYIMLVPIAFIDFKAITFFDSILVIALTIVTVGLGHSVGLHRGIIHKSYDTSSRYRNVGLFLFILTGLGSPLSWLKQHYYRDYWQNREDCPRYFRYQHSLITDYWWNLHLQFSPVDEELYQIPTIDLNDKTINHLHKYWYLYYLSFLLILYVLFGLNTALLASCFRTSLIILGHWYIGFASHKYGYAKHEIQNADESGYNDVLLGFVSFGEGFHNNHHAFPTSAKFSSRWYEVDFGWFLVWLLKKLKVVSNVKTQKHTLKSTATPFERLKWKFPW